MMSREWPHMNQKFYLLHSDMFVIQVIARCMDKARLETESEIISRNVSKVASKLWELLN